MPGDRYIFRVDKELIGLRYIEMDAVCRRLFSGKEIVLLAHAGDVREFNIMRTRAKTTELWNIWPPSLFRALLV